MSDEEQLHPSITLREKARTAMKTCLKCGFLHVVTLPCPQCGTREEKTVSWKCYCCGFETDHEPEECPRCEEQKQVFEEERRRGVREEEPPPKLLAAQAIEDALPILWQAALYSDDPDTFTKVLGSVQVLGLLKFRLEGRP